jgi:type IV secretion system protein TrbL
MSGTSGGSGWDPIGGITNLINGAAGTVSYWSDPWGNTFKALQSAAVGMSKQILPALTSATMPDLDTAWLSTPTGFRLRRRSSWPSRC